MNAVYIPKPPIRPSPADEEETIKILKCSSALVVIPGKKRSKIPEYTIVVDSGGVSSESDKERTQRSEEPPVLSARVAVLQDLLDRLLSLLALADLLEGVGGDDALQTLELESVAGGHQVVVVDNLDERLDLAPLVLPCLAHPPCDLAGVTLDAGDDRVAVRVALVAGVDRLDDDDLLQTKAMSEI